MIVAVLAPLLARPHGVSLDEFVDNYAVTLVVDDDQCGSHPADGEAKRIHQGIEVQRHHP